RHRDESVGRVVHSVPTPRRSSPSSTNGERVMTATVVADAKLTVTLRVTGRREDGYHLIDAEMVTIDLADTLVFDDGDGLLVESSFDVSAGEDNLVCRALRAVD